MTGQSAERIEWSEFVELLKDGWNESDHPRDPDGKFGSGGGGGSGGGDGKRVASDATPVSERNALAGPIARDGASLSPNEHEYLRSLNGRADPKKNYGETRELQSSIRNKLGLERFANITHVSAAHTAHEDRQGRFDGGIDKPAVSAAVPAARPSAPPPPPKPPAVASTPTVPAVAQPARPAVSLTAPQRAPVAPVPVSSHRFESDRRSYQAKLSKTEAETARSYGDSRYVDVNGLLRGTMSTGEAKERDWSGQQQTASVGQLDSALAKGRSTEDRIVFRGAVDDTGKMSGLKPGDTFKDNGYLSTSYTPHNTFMEEANVEFHITAPKGTPMGAIPTRYSHEGELLIGRGAKMRIDKREDLGQGRVRLHATIVGTTPP